MFYLFIIRRKLKHDSLDRVRTCDSYSESKTVGPVWPYIVKFKKISTKLKKLVDHKNVGDSTGNTLTTFVAAPKIPSRKSVSIHTSKSQVPKGKRFGCTVNT